MTDVNSNDIRCNTGTQANAAKTSVATVTAGSTVGMALDQPIYHPGPINVYMSKAPGNVQEYDGSGTWFKISQLGATISSGAISWPANNLGQYTFKIPSSTRAYPYARCRQDELLIECIANGQYLLRMEHIALHSASSTAGAQFYLSCAQITVTGGGSGSPGPTIKLPGGYSPSDKGILINIYYPVSS